MPINAGSIVITATIDLSRITPGLSNLRATCKTVSNQIGNDFKQTFINIGNDADRGTEKASTSFMGLARMARWASSAIGRISAVMDIMATAAASTAASSIQYTKNYGEEARFIEQTLKNKAGNAEDNLAIMKKELEMIRNISNLYEKNAKLAEFGGEWKIGPEGAHKMADIFEKSPGMFDNVKRNKELAASYELLRKSIDDFIMALEPVMTKLSKIVGDMGKSGTLNKWINEFEKIVIYLGKVNPDTLVILAAGFKTLSLALAGLQAIGGVAVMVSLAASIMQLKVSLNTLNLEKKTLAAIGKLKTSSIPGTVAAKIPESGVLDIRLAERTLHLASADYEKKIKLLDKSGDINGVARYEQFAKAVRDELNQVKSGLTLGDKHHTLSDDFVSIKNDEGIFGKALSKAQSEFGNYEKLLNTLKPAVKESDIFKTAADMAKAPKAPGLIKSGWEAGKESAIFGDTIKAFSDLYKVTKSLIPTMAGISKFFVGLSKFAVEFIPFQMAFTAFANLFQQMNKNNLWKQLWIDVKEFGKFLALALIPLDLFIKAIDYITNKIIEYGKRFGGDWITDKLGKWSVGGEGVYNPSPAMSMQNVDVKGDNVSIKPGAQRSQQYIDALNWQSRMISDPQFRKSEEAKELERIRMQGRAGEWGTVLVN